MARKGAMKWNHTRFACYILLQGKQQKYNASSWTFPAEFVQAKLFHYMALFLAMA